MGWFFSKYEGFFTYDTQKRQTLWKLMVGKVRNTGMARMRARLTEAAPSIDRLAFRDIDTYVAAGFLHVGPPTILFASLLYCMYCQRPRVGSLLVVRVMMVLTNMHASLFPLLVKQPIVRRQALGSPVLGDPPRPG
jgi:hypothetical protein